MNLRAALRRLEERYVPVFEHWHPVSLVLIPALLIVLLASLLVAYSVLPSWRAWQAANQRLTELEAQTAIPASALGDLERLKADSRRLAELLAVVPRGPTGGAVAIEQIRALSVAAGLQRFEVKLLGDPSAAKKEGLGFSIEAEGPYARIGAWLDEAPRALPWLEVRRIELSGAASAGAAGTVAMKYHGTLPAELLAEEM